MPLLPTPEILSHRGLLPSQIHIRNLHSVIVAGLDAWGRPQKPQPLLVSVSVGLSRPFATSSASDAVDASTVHYGLLAKNILASLECYSPFGTGASTASSSGTGGTPVATGVAGGIGADAGTVAGGTLATVLVRVWSHLTGLSVDGRERSLPEDETPFLDVTKLRSLSLSLVLPKASLLGTGVGITATALFGPPEVAPGLVSAFAIQLAVRGVRVPTLVGVNANERLAKQVVITDVEVERFDIEGDVYTELEGLVVKTMEKSSYETLEALGTHLAEEIMSFVPPKDHLSGRQLGWQVKVTLEKPIAIPLADGPIVEVIVG